MSRPKKVEQYDGPPVGSLVRYYDEGWRYGRIDEVIKGLAWIRPIVSKYAGTPRCVKVPISDLEIEKEVNV